MLVSSTWASQTDCNVCRSVVKYIKPYPATKSRLGVLTAMCLKPYQREEKGRGKQYLLLLQRDSSLLLRNWRSKRFKAQTARCAVSTCSCEHKSCPLQSAVTCRGHGLLKAWRERLKQQESGLTVVSFTHSTICFLKAFWKWNIFQPSE